MFAFKIWIIASILLTAYGDLTDSDDAICAEGRERCDSEETKELEFPGTIEEMDKICPAKTAKQSCLLDYQNRCGDPWPRSIANVAESAHALTLEACDKESELHQDLANHLPCIKRLMKNSYNICEEIVKEAMEAVNTQLFLKTKESEPSREDFWKFMCLRKSYGLACFLASAGVDCGSETQELVGGILDRIGLLDQLCPADIREEVKGMVEIIQLEMEENIALAEVFSEE